MRGWGDPAYRTWQLTCEKEEEEQEEEEEEEKANKKGDVSVGVVVVQEFLRKQQDGLINWTVKSLKDTSRQT